MTTSAQCPWASAQQGQTALSWKPRLWLTPLTREALTGSDTPRSQASPSVTTHHPRKASFFPGWHVPWHGLGEAHSTVLFRVSTNDLTIAPCPADHLLSLPLPCPQHPPTGRTGGDPQILRNLYLHEHFQGADIEAGGKNTRSTRSHGTPGGCGTWAHALAPVCCHMAAG